MKFALNIHSHLCLSLFQVIRTILDLLPQNPKVHQVMIDFEEAMWNYLPHMKSYQMWWWKAVYSIEYKR